MMTGRLERCVVSLLFLLTVQPVDAAEPQAEGKDPPDPTALERVAELRRGDREVRWDAALALKAMKDQAGDLRAPLLALVEGGDDEAAVFASFVLSEIDPKALADSPKVAKFLTRYVNAVESNDPLLAPAAVHSIGALGAKGAPAIPALIAYADESLSRIEDLEKRGWAGIFLASAVVRIGPAAMPELAKAMRSAGPKGRCTAARLLQNFTQDAAEHFPKQGDGPLPELPAEAIPPLLEMVASPDRGQRTCALPLLRAYGPRAKEAAPHLLRMLDSTRIKALVEGDDWKALSSELRAVRNVAETLGRVDPDALHASDEAKSLVPLLAKALTWKGREPAGAAANALAHLGPPAAATIPLILKEAVRERPGKQEPADEPDRAFVWALKPMGAIAVPELVKALREHDDREIRVAAAVALRMLGESAREAMPALEEAKAHDEAKMVRDEASNAISIIADAVRVKGSD